MFGPLPNSFPTDCQRRDTRASLSAATQAWHAVGRPITIDEDVGYYTVASKAISSYELNSLYSDFLFVIAVNGSACAQSSLTAAKVQ